jgi:hypothetical protein
MVEHGIWKHAGKGGVDIGLFVAENGGVGVGEGTVVLGEIRGVFGEEGSAKVEDGEIGIVLAGARSIVLGDERSGVPREEGGVVVVLTK